MFNHRGTTEMMGSGTLQFFFFNEAFHIAIEKNMLQKLYTFIFRRK